MTEPADHHVLRLTVGNVELRLHECPWCYALTERLGAHALAAHNKKLLMP
jgi:hypothetical protein